jgi:ABC-type uncharacterized transport system ATPase subunit
MEASGPTATDATRVARMLADNAGDGLQIVGLTKRYDRVTAVEDLNLSVRPGEVVGFLGPNGAGKPRRCERCWG